MVSHHNVYQDISEAYLYYSLDELVIPGKNGVIFQDAPELAEQLEVGVPFLFSQGIANTL